MTQTPSGKEIALEARDRAGERLSSPSAGRNRAVIAETLAGLLPEGARVFEVASGTGEHALSCVSARPDLSWQPSEPNAESRASVDAWATEAEGRIAPCLDFDVTQRGWADRLGPFDALFCANMIHIAPWEAAVGIFEGASKFLTREGRVYLYGPFKEGEQTAPSNMKFDEDLKRRDPRWGVRALADIDAMAGDYGFIRVGRIEMPANNLMVSWARAS